MLDEESRTAARRDAYNQLLAAAGDLDRTRRTDGPTVRSRDTAAMHAVRLAASLLHPLIEAPAPPFPAQRTGHLVKLVTDWHEAAVSPTDESPTTDLRADVDLRIKALLLDLEKLAGSAASEEDLLAVVKLVGHLSLIAGRVIGMSVMTYAHEGDIPGPPLGSFAMRASHLLDGYVFGDRALDSAFQNAVLTQRSATYTYRALAGAFEAWIQQEQESTDADSST
jgi:hypothetical protein